MDRSDEQNHHEIGPNAIIQGRYQEYPCFQKSEKYGEGSGQRGDKEDRSNWSSSGFYLMLKRHPRGPESVDGRAPKSGSGHYGASQRAYMLSSNASQPTLA